MATDKNVAHVGKVKHPDVPGADNAMPAGVGVNPFASTDPQDAKAQAQRTFTAKPAGPVPGVNPHKAGTGVPLPVIDAKMARTLKGPQS